MMDHVFSKTARYYDNRKRPLRRKKERVVLSLPSCGNKCPYAFTKTFSDRLELGDGVNEAPQ